MTPLTMHTPQQPFGLQHPSSLTVMPETVDLISSHFMTIPEYVSLKILRVFSSTTKHHTPYYIFLRLFGLLNYRIVYFIFPINVVAFNRGD